MTAPGGGFGEGAHDDKAGSAPAGGGRPEQPDPTAPWEPPAAPPPPEAVPPPYPAPGYAPDYSSGNAPSYPPPVPPPPGYEQPPGYAGPAYPPPSFGGPPTYGPPAYPGGYYPAPDYQGGYGPAPAQPGTNTLAIASLIASFTGLLCCIGSIVGIVLGTIALDQIKRTRQDGFGLAVAGIVIGIAMLLVTFVVVLFAMRTH